MPLLQIGDRIHQQLIVRRVLPGGMGLVYVAQDPESGETLAVKTFAAETFEAYEGASERFKQEARIWIRLGKHPNIVTALILNMIDHRPHLFLEYVDGGDLSQWIREARLTLNRTVRFALQFATE